MVADAFDFFRATPDAESRMLRDRESNEAYLAYVPNKQYALYFPDRGEARLDLSGTIGTFEARWLNIEGSNWFRTEMVSAGEHVRLAAPYAGHWIVLLTRSGG